MRKENDKDGKGTERNYVVWQNSMKEGVKDAGERSGNSQEGVSGESDGVRWRVK